MSRLTSWDDPRWEQLSSPVKAALRWAWARHILVQPIVRSEPEAGSRVPKTNVDEGGLVPLLTVATGPPRLAGALAHGRPLSASSEKDPRFAEWAGTCGIDAPGMSGRFPERRAGQNTGRMDR